MNFSIPPIGISGKEEEAPAPSPMTIFIPLVDVAKPAPREVDPKLWADYKRIKASIARWQSRVDRESGPFTLPHPLLPVIEKAEGLALRLKKQLQSQMLGE